MRCASLDGGLPDEEAVLGQMNLSYSRGPGVDGGGSPGDGGAGGGGEDLGPRAEEVSCHPSQGWFRGWRAY